MTTIYDVIAATSDGFDEVADQMNDLNARIVVLEAGGVGPGTVEWTDILNVPLDFPPSSHTHVVADITDYTEHTQDLIASTLVAGSNITLTYNDGAGTLTVASAGAGGGTAWADLTGMPAAIDAIDGLTPAADRIAYYTSSSAASVTPLTTAGRALIDDATASDQLTTLGVSTFAKTILDDADAAAVRTTIGAAAAGNPTESIIVAVGDETTTLTTGTAKVTFRMPYAFTLSTVKASLTTVSSSGTPTVDINEGGVSIFSTRVTIDASEKTSTTAAVPAVLSDVNLADDAEITIDVDVAGTGAKGLKVYLIGNRP